MDKTKKNQLVIQAATTLIERINVLVNKDERLNALTPIGNIRDYNLLTGKQVFNQFRNYIEGAK